MKLEEAKSVSAHCGIKRGVMEDWVQNNEKPEILHLSVQTFASLSKLIGLQGPVCKVIMMFLSVGYCGDLSEIVLVNGIKLHICKPSINNDYILSSESFCVTEARSKLTQGLLFFLLGCDLWGNIYLFPRHRVGSGAFVPHWTLS